MKNLIIVESPTKANTIKKFLPHVTTIATKGYLKDLPVHELGLSIKDERYIGKWVYLSGQKKLMSTIKELAKSHDNIYLAVDDDREGESIAEQVASEALKGKNFRRIVFHEITKTAIEHAIAEGGRTISDNTVEAAHTRRMGDRLIGYPMSEIIAFDFQKNKHPYKPKGIGRVISPALQILKDNHFRIEEFTPSNYYQIGVDYAHEGKTFRAFLKVRFEEKDKETVDELMIDIRNSDHIVSKNNEKTRDVAPFPPLVTARLVRSAFYLYGFKPKQTMKLAQKLYELGLITYMRTDSTKISDEAVSEIISLLKRKFSPEFFVDKKREFKNNNKNAQKAHEAIRPTSFDDHAFPKHLPQNHPELTQEHQNLYEFIFYRTVATQMSNAVYDASTIEIQIGENLVVSAEANNQLFAGWQKLHGAMLREAERVEGEEWKQNTVLLPRVIPGAEVNYVDLLMLTKQTRTPARYGVGRFVTELESFTRPSTLDSIIDKLEESGYIEILKGMIYMTNLGIAVAEWTEKEAFWLSDKENTEKMEEALDLIEHGDCANPDSLLHQYSELIEALKKKIGFIERDYWTPSEGQVKMATSIAKKLKLSDDEIARIVKHKKSCETFLNENKVKRKKIGKCPACKLLGKEGVVYENEKAFGCSNYKDGCKFTIWKKSVVSTLDRFKQNSDCDMVTNVVTKGLTKAPLLLENLQGPNGLYNAKLEVEKSLVFGWQLSLKYQKKKKTNEKVA